MHVIKHIKMKMILFSSEGVQSDFFLLALEMSKPKKWEKTRQTEEKSQLESIKKKNINKGKIER